MSGRDLVEELRNGAKPAPRATGRGWIDLLLVAVAVLGLGFASYFGVSSFLAKHAPGNAAPPGPAVTLLADAKSTRPAWTADDTARCTARARAAVEALIPNDFAFANPAVAPGFAGLTTRLQCEFATKPARFCEPEEKAKLVASVNDYLTRSDLIVAGLGLQGAPMAVMGQLMGGEAAAGSAIYDMERDATLDFMHSHHLKLVAAFRALARDGLIMPEDFAGFLGGVPENIVTLFGGISAQRNICA